MKKEQGDSDRWEGRDGWERDRRLVAEHTSAPDEREAGGEERLSPVPIHPEHHK